MNKIPNRISLPRALAMSFILGMSAALAINSPTAAAFNEPDEKELAATEREEKLDVTVTQFKKDGTSGTVFEFNPTTIPGLRCVAFHYGQPAGMQCFPRPEAPKER